MHLRDYLAAKSLTPAAFAAVLDVHHDAVRKWLRGERMPRPAQMRRIAETTRGAVTANDFHGTEPEKKARPARKARAA